MIPRWAHIPVFVFLITLVVRADDGSMENPCTAISGLLKVQAEACRCFPPGVGSGGLHMTTSSEQDASGVEEERLFNASPWIGCSRERMPAIYRSLAALPNKTRIQKLWIWDSLIPVVPQNFFSKIVVKHLILESSHVGQFFTGIFKPFAGHLRVLILKNNIIYRIDAGLFAGLNEVKVLDLSGNLLSQIGTTSFGDHMKKLEILNLNHNNISSIKEGAFRHLAELQVLSLAFNALKTLEMDSLSGLNNLKHLDLERNHLEVVPVGIFDHLLHLRTLNVGHNCLKAISLPTLPSLTTLFVHNNSLSKVAEIDLHSPLDSLESLYLDQNFITALDAQEFANYPSLTLLSLTSNRLSNIHAHAFRQSFSLWSLSLQKNQLSHLPPSVFSSLGNLSKLLLSENNLTSLTEDTLKGLANLQLLSVSHNKLRHLDASSFLGLDRLQKLYLNDNELQHVTNESFNHVMDTLFLLDLSDNPWRCDCKTLWLAKWLQEGNDEGVLVNTLHTRCVENAAPVGTVFEELAVHCLENGGNGSSMAMFNQHKTNDFWISTLSILLAVVSLLILAAIALMYIQDGRMLSKYAYIRRTPSDMVTLISNSK